MALQISTTINGFEAPTAYVKIDRVQAEGTNAFPLYLSIFKDQETREATPENCVRQQVSIDTAQITYPVTITPVLNASGVVTMSASGFLLTVAYELLKKLPKFSGGTDC